MAVWTQVNAMNHVSDGDSDPLVNGAIWGGADAAWCYHYFSRLLTTSCYSNASNNGTREHRRTGESLRVPGHVDAVGHAQPYPSTYS